MLAPGRRYAVAGHLRSWRHAAGLLQGPHPDRHWFWRYPNLLEGPGASGWWWVAGACLLGANAVGTLGSPLVALNPPLSVVRGKRNTTLESTDRRRVSMGMALRRYAGYALGGEGWVCTYLQLLHPVLTLGLLVLALLAFWARGTRGAPFALAAAGTGTEPIPTILACVASGDMAGGRSLRER